MILKVQEWNYTLRLTITFISSHFTGQSKWKAWARFNGWEKYLLRFRKTTGIWHGEMDTGEKDYINCFIFLPLVPTLEWDIICVHPNLLLCLPRIMEEAPGFTANTVEESRHFFFSSEMRATSKTILCYILGIGLKCLRIHGQHWSVSWTNNWIIEAIIFASSLCQFLKK